MKIFLLVVLLGLLFTTVSAGKELYNRDRAPSTWSRGARSPPNTLVSFTLALHQQNLDVLERIASEVSNPWHDNYQEFKTIEEINAIVAPPASQVNELIATLGTYGIGPKQIKNYGDALRCYGVPVSIAENIFNTEYYTFTAKSDGRVIHKAWGTMSLPDSFTPLVDFASGISNFPIPKPKVSFPFAHSADPDQATQVIIPQSIYQIYGVPANQVPASQRSMSQGVIEFEDENFNNTDLVQYGNITGTPVRPVQGDQVIGANNQLQPGVESSLDIQIMAGVSLEPSTWFYIQDPVDWLYEFVNDFFNNATVPRIVSISYGWWEMDQCRWDQGGTYCQTIGVDNLEYVRRINWGFAKIASRGVSIIVASGDSGANGRTDEDCSIKQLRPAFPSSSPWVTSVGGTEIANATFNLPNPPAICGSQYSCVGGGYEQAVSINISGYASGGGFSNISARPDWQWDAVAAYFNSSVTFPPASYYNGMGRGAPDISAIGHNALIVISGSPFPVSGTSQSAPTAAAIFGLLQQFWYARTGGPFGFLNPLIYGVWAMDPTSFIDITIGDNRCTESGCRASCTGFYCTTGWDAVTGLGSPNYPRLKANLMQVADMVVARRKAKAKAKAQATQA